MNLSQAVDLYIDKHPKLAPRTVYDYNAVVSKYASKLFEVEVETISIDQVEAVYKAALGESVSQAYKMLTLAGTALKFAIGWHNLSVGNPFKWFKEHGEVQMPPKRNRRLAEKDFPVFFHEIAQIERIDQAIYLQLLLYTGARKEEIGDLYWDEVDLNSGVILIRGKEYIRNGKPRRKVKHDLRIVLCEESLNLLRRLWIRRRSPVGAVPIFFPSSKDAYEGIVERTGIDCRPHDLRRTYISIAVGIGIEDMAVRKLAGHAIPGSTGDYVHLLDSHALAFNERIFAEMRRLAFGAARAEAQVLNYEIKEAA